MEQLDLKAEHSADFTERPDTVVDVGEGPVLVAVDFSAEARAALLWGSDYASRVGAALEVLHVIHDPAESPGAYRPENGNSLEPMADVAQRKLDALIGELREQRPEAEPLQQAQTICVEGLPASTILDVAEQRGARQIVVGGRGRNGLTRMLLGSTSDAVMRRARIPVTVVKADGT